MRVEHPRFSSRRDSPAIPSDERLVGLRFGKERRDLRADSAAESRRGIKFRGRLATRAANNSCPAAFTLYIFAGIF